MVLFPEYTLRPEKLSEFWRLLAEAGYEVIPFSTDEGRSLFDRLCTNVKSKDIDGYEAGCLVIKNKQVIFVMADTRRVGKPWGSGLVEIEPVAFPTHMWWPTALENQCYDEIEDVLFQAGGEYIFGSSSDGSNEQETRSDEEVFGRTFATAVLYQLPAVILIFVLSDGVSQWSFLRWIEYVYRPGFYIYREIAPTSWQFSGSILLELGLVGLTVIVYGVIIAALVLFARFGFRSEKKESKA